MTPRKTARVVDAYRQSGAAAVEFAFIIVILLLIVAGLVSFGRIFWYADALTKATRDGARLLSIWDVNDPNYGDITNGVAKVKTEVVARAASANLSPPLTGASVIVECDNSSPAAPTYNFGSCASGTKPTNVKVSISGFNVSLGEWFPFIGAGGLIDYGTIGLSPHTTMRYMK